MHRVLTALFIVAAIWLVVAPGAAAKEDVTARIDISDAALEADPGATVRVRWTLTDAGGEPFGAGGLFVRLTSAVDGASTTAGGRGSDGRYSALVRVPEGGIGGIQLGLVGTRTVQGMPSQRGDVLFPIENNPFDEQGEVYNDYYVGVSGWLFLFAIPVIVLAIIGLLVIRWVRRRRRVA